MLLTKKEIEIVDKAIKDYEFMKYACDNLITKYYTDNYDSTKIKEILERIKGVDVYCIEDGYIDFYYNGLSLCYYNNENQHYLGSGLSIWNNDAEEYIYECVDYNAIKNDIVDNKNEDNIYCLLNKATEKIRENKEKNYGTEYLKKEMIRFIEDRF